MRTFLLDLRVCRLFRVDPARAFVNAPRMFTAKEILGLENLYKKKLNSKEVTIQGISEVAYDPTIKGLNIEELLHESKEKA